MVQISAGSAQPATDIQGLPTVILPGYLAGAEPYQPLAQWLSDRGFPTTVVPLKRSDWFPTLGGRPVTPILGALEVTVTQVLAETGATKINLIGHSAGGWISRIWLGDRPYGPTQQTWQGRDRTAALICLGTPHRSQERWTRRNIDFVNEQYPEAFYRDVRYICVAGKAVQGAQRWGQWVAYNSYSLTIGQGDSWGDGITPIAAAHLEGALNLTYEAVYHSPRPNRLWYGSPEIVEQWRSHLLTTAP
ncbi:lipase [Synechococcus elongatus]|uniref:esterase/lipase family protein n=1 Tax=Synechococcus elongatus TaxID=32046 RepID=UPI0030CDD61A